MLLLLAACVSSLLSLISADLVITNTNFTVYEGRQFNLTWKPGINVQIALKKSDTGDANLFDTKYYFKIKPDEGWKEAAVPYTEEGPYYFELSSFQGDLVDSPSFTVSAQPVLVTGAGTRHRSSSTTGVTSMTGTATTTSTSTSASARASPSLSTSTSLSTSLSTNTSSTSASTAPANSSPSTSNTGLPIGAIAGIGISAGLALLCTAAVVVGWVLYRRRTRSARSLSSENDERGRENDGGGQLEATEVELANHQVQEVSGESGCGRVEMETSGIGGPMARVELNGTAITRSNTEEKG